MESREEKTRAIIDAITQRAPGKRQIKLVSAVDFQLFEDLEDDSDNEFKVEANGCSATTSDSDGDDNDNEDNKITYKDDDNKSDEDEDRDASSSLKSNKSSGSDLDDEESDTTEDTDDDEDSSSVSSRESGKESSDGDQKCKAGGGDLRALIDGVVAASGRADGDPDDDDRTSSDEDWLEGRKKREQLKKQQKGGASKKTKVKKEEGSADSDGSEDAMLKAIKPRKKSTRRAAAKALKNTDLEEADADSRANSAAAAAALAAATAATIKKVERLTCMVCLSNRSDPENELVECDACHVTLHEACYGLADTQSLCSTGSSASTEPWFCDACAAGVSSPSCQLCPVTGGVFKPTEDGRWVHLVCALYTPDVAFNEVDALTDVTLTELKPKFWGAKECVHCLERNYAYTGVCVGCDAGLCRSCFHVTCAQREGLLSEPAAAAAAAEDADEIADPFYAQCRQHTDPFVAKQRRKAYITAFSRQRAALKEAASLASKTPVVDRIARKLAKRRAICAAKLAVKRPFFIPEQKQPLFLELSPHAVRLFAKKADIYGVGATANETGSLLVSGQERTAAQAGLPVFCPEFVQHFLDRETKILAMNKQLADLAAQESELIDRQSKETLLYSNAEASYQASQACLLSVRSAFLDLWDALNSILQRSKTFTQRLPPPQRLRIALEGSASALASGDLAGSIGEAAADSAAVEDDAMAATSIGPTKVGDLAAKAAALRRLNECTVCKAKKDQHLMVQCDACSLHYHIGCLDPPLTRVPKKTKMYGWECSVCVKDNSSDEANALENAEAGVVESLQFPTLQESLSMRRLRQQSAKRTFGMAEEAPATAAAAACSSSRRRPASSATRSRSRRNNNNQKLSSVESSLQQQPEQEDKIELVKSEKQSTDLPPEAKNEPRALMGKSASRNQAGSEVCNEKQTVEAPSKAKSSASAALAAKASVATSPRKISASGRPISGGGDSTSASAEEGINAIEVYDEGTLEIEYLKSDSTVSDANEDNDEAEQSDEEDDGDDDDYDAEVAGHDVQMEVIDEIRLEPSLSRSPSPLPQQQQQPRKFLFKSGNTVPCYLMHTLTPEERRRVEAESAALRLAKAEEQQQQQQSSAPPPHSQPSNQEPNRPARPGMTTIIVERAKPTTSSVSLSSITSATSCSTTTILRPVQQPPQQQPPPPSSGPPSASSPVVIVRLGQQQQQQPSQALSNAVTLPTVTTQIRFTGAGSSTVRSVIASSNSIMSSCNTNNNALAKLATSTVTTEAVPSKTVATVVASTSLTAATVTSPAVSSMPPPPLPPPPQPESVLTSTSIMPTIVAKQAADKPNIVANDEPHKKRARQDNESIIRKEENKLKAVSRDPKTTEPIAASAVSKDVTKVVRDPDEERRKRKREKRQRLEEAAAATAAAAAADAAERERRRLRKLEKLKKLQAADTQGEQQGRYLQKHSANPPQHRSSQSHDLKLLHQQQNSSARYSHNPHGDSYHHQLQLHQHRHSDDRKRHRSRSPPSTSMSSVSELSKKLARPSLPHQPTTADSPRQHWEEMKAKIEQVRAKSLHSTSSSSQQQQQQTPASIKPTSVTVVKQVARRTPSQTPGSTNSSSGRVGGGSGDDDILQFMLQRKKQHQQQPPLSRPSSAVVAQKPRGFSQLLSGRAAAASSSMTSASTSAGARPPSYLPSPLKIATVSASQKVASTQLQQHQKALINTVNKVSTSGKSAKSSSSASSSSSSTSDEESSSSDEDEKDNNKITAAAAPAVAALAANVTQEQLQDRKFNHLVKDIFGDD